MTWVIEVAGSSRHAKYITVDSGDPGWR
jgi:hypothetical protein